ncbi:MAG: peptide deformylase [Bacteroidota bacterium]
MILPIYVYGAPILTQRTIEVTENTPELQQLIDDMIETMHGASGIGLAAPQVGRSERLFVVDLSPMVEDDEDAEAAPVVFINPEIYEESEEDEEYEEGCLSIPDIREYVIRPEGVRLRYMDRNFKKHDIVAEGMLARVIQHEFDHLDGVLFLDHISPFKRRLLKRRLKEMARGNIEADYPLKFTSVV